MWLSFYLMFDRVRADKRYGAIAVSPHVEVQMETVIGFGDGHLLDDGFVLFVTTVR